MFSKKVKLKYPCPNAYLSKSHLTRGTYKILLIHLYVNILSQYYCKINLYFKLFNKFNRHDKCYHCYHLLLELHHYLLEETRRHEQFSLLYNQSERKYKINKWDEFDVSSIFLTNCSQFWLRSIQEENLILHPMQGDVWVGILRNLSAKAYQMGKRKLDHQRALIVWKHCVLKSTKSKRYHYSWNNHASLIRY